MVMLTQVCSASSQIKTQRLTQEYATPRWPVDCDRLITPANRYIRPISRHAPLHIREFTGTAQVRASRTPKSLLILQKPLDLNKVAAHKPGAMSLGALLEEETTNGLIVLHQGTVVAEYVGLGANPRTPHSLTSASKSVVACVAGILVGQGLIERAFPVERYLPELSGTGYEGVTVSQTFDMQSGVVSSGDDEFLALGWHPLQGDKPAVGLYQHVLSRPRVDNRDAVYASRSTDIDVLALICERVTSKPMNVLVSELLWQPIGAEDDAYFELDRQGTIFFGGGLSASLRDMARFGRMLQNDGKVGDVQVVPGSFISDTRRSTEALRRAFSGSFFGHDWPKAAYHNHFWLDPQHHGATLNFGAFGNMMYIDPQLQTVCVMNSAWANMHSDVMKWFAALRATSAAAAEHVAQL